MVRFLSPEWFAAVASSAPPRPAGLPAAEPDDLVLEQVVRNGPDGEVRYRVVVTGRAAYIEAPAVSDREDPAEAASGRAPDLTIACDWATATQVAQGTLSTQAALMAGRLRISGNMARLSGRAADLVGLDPVPESVRRRTTY